MEIRVNSPGFLFVNIVKKLVTLGLLIIIFTFATDLIV
jgi:hypothetical protein